MKRKINEQAIAENFKKIISEGLGLDIKDPNLKETPERVARAYKEIFSSLETNDKEVTKILSNCFETKYEGIVLEKDITVFSMCPHHFLPVRYEVSIGYVPNGCGLGLSKLTRIIELISKKPMLQEDFNQEIVDLLYKKLNAKGAICVVKGEHHCMRMRGAKQKDVVTTTSAVKGIFLTEKEMELKFYELLKI